MDREKFLNGLKVFWSSGGANPDEDTLEVWFQMLKHINPEDYAKAITHLMQNEKQLATINFIAEITERSKMFRDTREFKERRNQNELPPEGGYIPRDKLKKLFGDLVKNLGDIPKEKGVEDE